MVELIISIFFKPEMNNFLDPIFNIPYVFHVTNTVSIIYFHYRVHSLLLVSLPVYTDFHTNKYLVKLCFKNPSFSTSSLPLPCDY